MANTSAIRSGCSAGEDYDWIGFGFEDADPQSEQVTEAVLTFIAQAGFDPRYGRRVVANWQPPDCPTFEVRAEPW